MENEGSRKFGLKETLWSLGIAGAMIGLGAHGVSVVRQWDKTDDAYTIATEAKTLTLENQKAIQKIELSDRQRITRNEEDIRKIDVKLDSILELLRSGAN